MELPNVQSKDSWHIQQRYELIKQWKPEREVWCLKYGDLVIGALAGVNGVIINSMFRRSLKLRHNGWKFTMLFISTGPAIAAYSCHKYFITENLLLYRPKCMICQGFKAVSFFEANALLYSLIISPTINLAIAGSIGYRIPYIYEVKELLRFWWSVVKPRAKTLSAMFFYNMCITAIMTYSQMISIERITNTLLRIHEYTENKKNTGMDTKPSNTNLLP